MSALLVFVLLSAVRASADGVPGIEVELRAASTHPPQVQRTDAQGAFVFRNLAAGSYKVSLRPPQPSTPEGKSYFESPSNLRLTVVVGKASPLTTDFTFADGTLVRAKEDATARRDMHNMSKSVIQNIRAREAAAPENDWVIDVAQGQTVSGRATRTK